MRIRRLAPVVPAFFLPWAACNPSATDQFETQTFVAEDGESLRQAEELSMRHVFERQSSLLQGVDEVWTKRVKIDELGEAHTRLDQTVAGIPVLGGQAIVHLNPDGSFKSMTDKFVRDIGVDTTPRMHDAEAIELAVAQAGGWDKITSEPKAKLMIVPHDGNNHLAYEVRLESMVDEQNPSMPVMFVDAHSGDIFWQYEGIETARNRKTYTANNRTTLPGTLKLSETQTSSGDSVVDLAHANAGRTWDYYWNKHGRDSFNGAGAQITSSVHYSRNYVNAFWNGTQMVYGDGDGVNASPLVVLDVVGHELTHAVTSYESNLTYANESGALNEAMSDIFGAAIEAYRDGAVSANTWKIGEECWTPGTAGDALRYMNDPAAAGDYDYWPTRYTGTSDNGGVHWNSGIANLAFKLAVTGGTHPRGKTSTVVPALNSNQLTSLDMGAAIFYRANTIYLTPSSTFMDARAATVQAASELYGSTAASAIEQAWIAVGVPTPPTWVNIDTKANVSGAKSSSTRYSYTTPAGATSVRFTMSGGSGDADLYVKFGSEPTTANYDCRSVSATADESCVIAGAQQGTYHVLVYGYSAYSGVTFKADYSN